MYRGIQPTLIMFLDDSKKNCTAIAVTNLTQLVFGYPARIQKWQQAANSKLKQ
jgi:hypothetical protein